MNNSQTLAILVLMFTFVGCDQNDVHQEAKDQMRFVSNQIVQESISRYEIVKKSDNPMDACLQAGMVKQTMLAVQDEKGYLKWETIEKDDCNKAGMHN